MENRRKDYRHTFPPGESPAVELSRPGAAGTITADVVNLSVSGMMVHVNGPPLPARDTWVGRLDLPGRDAVRLRAAVVHESRHDDGVRVGFRFLSAVSPAARVEREQTLWRFLLEAQWEQRRRARGDG